MALSSKTVWEVRTSGDDGNGGGFVDGASGTDYSQQDAAEKSAADLTMHASTATKCHPAALGVAAADVGNIIYISAGTGWTPGWYEIKSQDGIDWTLDRSPSAAGNANLATFKMGGALATPGGLGKVLNDHGVAGMVGWIKSGTYTLNSATENTSGGPLHLTPNILLRIEGYETFRGDLGAKPVINAGTITGISVVKLNSYRNKGRHLVRNLKVDGNSGSDVIGFEGTGAYQQDLVSKCHAVGCTTGFSGSNLRPFHCIASGCGTGFYCTGPRFCRATGCTSHGFVGSISDGRAAVFCIADGNGGSGFYEGAAGTVWIGCIAYGNTGSGFDWRYQKYQHAYHCIACNNGGYGFDVVAADDDGTLQGCAGRNNTSGNYRAGTLALDFIELTADPFVNAAGGDFNLNDTEGGGALLRAIGLSLAL